MSEARLHFEYIEHPQQDVEVLAIVRRGESTFAGIHAKVDGMRKQSREAVRKSLERLTLRGKVVASRVTRWRAR